MSLYNYFPQDATMACWVQTPNLIDLHNFTHPTTSIHGISLCKPQLPWTVARIHQLALSACNDVISTYNCLSAMNARSSDHPNLSYQQLEDRQDHVPACPPHTSLGHMTPSAVATDTDVHESVPNASATPGNSVWLIKNNNYLKFGINRILSEDFGTRPTQTGTYYIMNSQPGHRKSWSRAVFSSLQRKGLEKRFQMQKYVTKPDRRQLAAMFGLTDAQVKVWFQNRRMKWRHAQQQEVKDKHIEKPDLQCGSDYSTFNMPSTPAGQCGSDYSNLNMASTSAGQCGSDYSNLNMASTPAGQCGSDYSNLNMASTSAGQCGSDYSNLNMASTPAGQCGSDYSNLNMASTPAGQCGSDYSNLNMPSTPAGQCGSDYSNLNMASTPAGQCGSDYSNLNMPSTPAGQCGSDYSNLNMASTPAGQLQAVSGTENPATNRMNH